jgi:hypothetical protein
MSKLLLVLNAVLVTLFVFIVVKASRMSHAVDPQLLLGLLPSIFAYVSLERSVNRSLGGLALIVNGLLLLCGLFGLIAALLGAGARGSPSDRLVLPVMATLLLVVGAANCKAIWQRFPRTAKGSK